MDLKLPLMGPGMGRGNFGWGPRPGPGPMMPGPRMVRGHSSFSIDRSTEKQAQIYHNLCGLNSLLLVGMFIKSPNELFL